MSHKRSLYTGVRRFPLDISTMLLLGNFIEQNKLHPILIRKYIQLEKNAGFPSNFINETTCKF